MFRGERRELFLRCGIVLCVEQYATASLAFERAHPEIVEQVSATENIGHVPGQAPDKQMAHEE